MMFERMDPIPIATSLIFEDGLVQFSREKKIE